MSLSTQFPCRFRPRTPRRTTLVPSGLKNALIQISKSLSWDSGTGASQADKVFSDTRTLGASATEDLDLAEHRDRCVRRALAFARVKLMYFFASTANNAANNVNVTRPASNGVPFLLAAGDGIALRPGAASSGSIRRAAGVAVTAATGDLITVTNSAGTNSVTYDVVIIGASA
jgi:hypothetical protein